MKTLNISKQVFGYGAITANRVDQKELGFIRGFNPTLKILIFLVVLLYSMTAPAQKFTYLNKYYFPISDTTKYQPQYYQQTLEKKDSLFISIYNFDHRISRIKIISFDKEKLEVLYGELNEKSVRNISSLKDYQSAQHSEYILDYYPNGNIKSKLLYVNRINMEEKYYDEEGNLLPAPYEMPAIPYDGVSAWYRYIMTSVQFPADARKNGETGRVHVYFELDEEGKIQQPEIMNPEEISPVLALEVLRVIEAYPHTWKPARKDGQSIRYSVKMPIGFQLN